MTAALLVARDSRTWDRYIAEATDGSILQSWAWGEVKRRYGWHPNRYFWERDGVVRGAISVLRRPLTGALSFDYAPHGPVLDGNLREWPTFWSALRDELAGGRGTILRVEPQWKRADTWIMEETGARPAHPVQHRATAMVDLRGGEAVFGRMSASARRNMRQAGRAGVAVEATTDPAAVDYLYELLDETARRQRFIARTPDYYREVFNQFSPFQSPSSGEGRVGASIYLAHHGGLTLAASTMIRYGRRLVYLFSGSNDDGRDLKAPYLIQQHAIRDAQAAGCTTYDLWGTPINASPGDAGWGYAHFKTMLGGVPRQFGGAWDLPIRWPLAAAYHLAERMVGRASVAA
jgi:serine/alanine adding enzyme